MSGGGGGGDGVGVGPNRVRSVGKGNGRADKSFMHGIGKIFTVAWEFHFCYSLQ